MIAWCVVMRMVMLTVRHYAPGFLVHQQNLIARAVHNDLCRCSVIVPNEILFQMASKIAQKAMGRVHKGKEKLTEQKVKEGREEIKEEKEDTGKESVETDGVYSE